MPFRNDFMTILVLRKNSDVPEGAVWTEVLGFCAHCAIGMLALRDKVANSFLRP